MTFFWKCDKCGATIRTELPGPEDHLCASCRAGIALAVPCTTMGGDPIGWCRTHNRWFKDCQIPNEIQALKTEVQSLGRALDIMSERIARLEWKNGLIGR